MCKKNHILTRFFLCMVSSVGGKFSLVDAPLALQFKVSTAQIHPHVAIVPVTDQLLNGSSQTAQLENPNSH